MRDFKKLDIWQRSHELTLRIYKLTNAFPKTEQYGLTSQLRRACASVPINIAEGCGRLSKKELARFVVIAAGSLSEVEYIVLLATELSYIPRSDYEPLNKEINEIKRMIYTFHKRIKT